MELICKTGITFLFSSIFVSFILLWYFKLDTKIEISKSKFINTMILVAFIHAIFQNTMPNVVVPFFTIIFPALLFTFVFNIKLLKSLWSIIKIFIITLIIEVLIAILLNTIFKIDIAKINLDMIGYIYILPVKFIEILAIIIIKRSDIKWDFGFLVNLARTLRKQKQK
jgi:hypothetical protein